LAGLRVGLLFAQEPLLEGLRKVKDSYSLDRLAIVAAAAAPPNDDADDDWVKANVARIRATRERLDEGCRSLGVDG
jgi:histidinol-phosphate aminotransferase